MASESVVDQIVKSLSFEVEAVPQDKDVQPSTSSNITPMNVKIRVRKKHESGMEKGIISVQKSPGSAPERMRLVSSDQTIMSFNVLMEAEFVKKGKRKPRKNFFGGCLGTQYDDDDGPYVPSTMYNAKKDDSSITSKSEGVLKQNFTLQKLYRDNTEPRPALTKHSILGKCKPGGCLDPPFGEDKYSYKPVEKVDDLITNIPKDEVIEKPDKKSDSFKDKCSKTVLKGKVDSESLLRLKETDSGSIITYPPEISSSQNIHDKFLKTRIISDEKQRKSATEGSEFFYTPAKRSRMESKDHKLSREGSSKADLGTEIPEKSNRQKLKMVKRTKGEDSAVELEDITTPQHHIKSTSLDQNIQKEMKEKGSLHPKQTEIEKISLYVNRADNNVHQRSSSVMPGKTKEQSSGKDIKMTKRENGGVSAELDDITTPKDHMKSPSPDKNIQEKMKEKGSIHPKQTGIEKISVYGAQADNNVHQRSSNVIPGETKEQSNILPDGNDIKISKRKIGEVSAEFDDITTPNHHIKSASPDQNIQGEIKEKQSTDPKQTGIEKISVYGARAVNNVHQSSFNVIPGETEEQSSAQDIKISKRKKGEALAEFKDITSPQHHMKSASIDQNTQEEVKDKESIHPKQIGIEKSTYDAQADNNLQPRSSTVIHGEIKDRSPGKDIKAENKIKHFVTPTSVPIAENYNISLTSIEKTKMQKKAPNQTASDEIKYQNTDTGAFLDVLKDDKIKKENDKTDMNEYLSKPNNISADDSNKITSTVSLEELQNISHGSTDTSKAMIKPLQHTSTDKIKNESKDPEILANLMMLNKETGFKEPASKFNMGYTKNSKTSETFSRNELKDFDDMVYDKTLIEPKELNIKIKEKSTITKTPLKYSSAEKIDGVHRESENLTDLMSDDKPKGYENTKPLTNKEDGMQSRLSKPFSPVDSNFNEKEKETTYSREYLNEKMKENRRYDNNTPKSMGTDNDPKTKGIPSEKHTADQSKDKQLLSSYDNYESTQNEVDDEMSLHRTVGSIKSTLSLTDTFTTIRTPEGILYNTDNLQNQLADHESSFDHPQLLSPITHYQDGQNNKERSVLSHRSQQNGALKKSFTYPQSKSPLYQNELENDKRATLLGSQQEDPLNNIFSYQQYKSPIASYQSGRTSEKGAISPRSQQEDVLQMRNMHPYYQDRANKDSSDLNAFDTIGDLMDASQDSKHLLDKYSEGDDDSVSNTYYKPSSVMMEHKGFSEGSLLRPEDIDDETTKVKDKLMTPKKLFADIEHTLEDDERKSDLTPSQYDLGATYQTSMHSSMFEENTGSRNHVASKQYGAMTTSDVSIQRSFDKLIDDTSDFSKSLNDIRYTESSLKSSMSSGSKPYGKFEGSTEKEYDTLSDKRKNLHKRIKDSHGSLKRPLKDDLISLNLGFKSYENDKKERILETFDTSKEPKRKPDDAITVIRTQIRARINDLRIPIDSENEMSIQIRRRKSPLRVQIEEKCEASSTRLDKFGDKKPDKETQDLLNCIYERDLVPLHKAFKYLKRDLDMLAIFPKTKFKDKAIGPRRSNIIRIVKVKPKPKCCCWENW